jgi:nucleotide-binding universal stress UspA family protein
MKILIATNDSKCSANAIERLLSGSWAADDQFRVFCVVEMLLGQYPMVLSYVDGLVESQHLMMEEGKQLVKRTMTRIQSKFPQNSITGNVGEGCASDLILEEAKSWHADLIILGTHGRKGINKFVHGSVSETVASNALCAVEIMS